MAGIQILVVDDDAMHAKLVSFLLQDAGNTVEIAESGERALEVLRLFRPDLILMDLQLPGKNGGELTRELRLDPAYVTTLIIALSAYADGSVLAKAREAGCDGNIPKPIDPASFARQVRNLLGGNPPSDSDAASDSGDLLADVRNNFLAEGLEQCDTLLNDLKSTPDCAMGNIQGILHRWTVVGGTLGFPEISSQVCRVKALLSSPGLEQSEVVSSVETARRRFCAATRHEPELPINLIADLMDVRIGLVNMSEEEAGRIQTAAKRANVKVVLERVNGDSVEGQPNYAALVINECGQAAGAPSRRPLPSIPVVFIGSRSCLEALSKLPSCGCDFLIAPWEPAEILIRVHRLIGKPAGPQLIEDSQPVQKRRSRILIGDDDPDMVFLVSDALGKSGMDCDIARSGQQVLDSVRRHRPDALVLDVNMIGLSGFETLETLRHNATTKALPVVLLTARNHGRDIARGFGCGADDYVIKPFQPSDLAKRVEKAISDSRKPVGWTSA